MKSHRTENKAKNSSEYPCLKKAKDHNKDFSYIVLFTSLNEGFVVWSERYAPNKLGTYSKYWQPSYFEPFYGTINLES